jgi:signal transduction histidine kinase
MFELQAASKGLGFCFEASGNLPELVRADEKRLRQILINLLGNAIKFTAAGQVTFRLRHAREMAYIDIEDTGPGMSEAELNQIFEPFARGNTAGQSATGAPGAGLGLTIAKMLTDLMGGEMTVASTPGQGSVFRIRLFLPEVHAAAGAGQGVKAPPARRRPQGYEGPRRKLLVVDNEEADRELLVQLLQPMGFELRTAASGHDCLDLLAAGYQPDVIFMDLAMPGIDGWETLRRVRAAGHLDARLAIVSANAFDKGLDNDVGIRPDDFILKPVRHTELIDWLAQRLALRWQYEAAPAALVLAPLRRVLPQAPQLAALLELVNLGFYRGILNKLAEIETQQPDTAGFVEDMRLLARQFQFEAMSRQLTHPEADHEPRA